MQQGQGTWAPAPQARPGNWAWPTAPKVLSAQTKVYLDAEADRLKEARMMWSTAGYQLFRPSVFMRREWFSTIGLSQAFREHDHVNRVLRHSLKAWRTQMGPPTDADVWPAMEGVLQWLDTVALGESAALVARAIPARGGCNLMWLDAYIALLEE